jgi:hypothetical protein
MLKKLLRTAMGLGISASCLMVVDKRTDSLSARFSVVLLFCVSFYYWIRYLKAYIDQRIKMRDDLGKTGVNQSGSDKLSG